MNRWLQLMLLMPEDEFITYKALSEELGISVRTVYDDISLVAEYEYKYSPDNIGGGGGTGGKGGGKPAAKPITPAVPITPGTTEEKPTEENGEEESRQTAETVAQSDTRGRERQKRPENTPEKGRRKKKRRLPKTGEAGGSAELPMLVSLARTTFVFFTEEKRREQ